MSIPRVKFIHQKRGALKGQMTSLENVLTEQIIDTANATLRFARIKELFHAYEELHDELAVDYPEDETLSQMEEIRNRFYEIATRVTNLSATDGLTSTSVNNAMPLGSSTFIERQKSLKLPTADLPKFSGEFDKWITFKNSFKAMVDSRSDIDNVVKFFYLRNALEGEAFNKVSIYSLDSENYSRAWQTLIEAYDRKRIVVAKHLDAIIDIKPLEIATARELVKLIDDTRQHLNILNSLSVKLDDNIVVRFLERALPAKIREKWEDTLDLDACPKLEDFFKFITATSFRLSTMERENIRVIGDKGVKRPADRDQSSASKRAKSQSSAHAFVANTFTIKCFQCGEAHRIYACTAYNNLSIDDRWEVVRLKKLCENCLGSHAGACNSGSCKICKGPHHTSLHRDIMAGEKENK